MDTRRIFGENPWGPSSVLLLIVWAIFFGKGGPVFGPGWVMESIGIVILVASQGLAVMAAIRQRWGFIYLAPTALFVVLVLISMRGGITIR